MGSYRIVYSDDSGGYVNSDERVKNLEEKVNKMLAEGWSCIGGVVIVTDGEGSYILRMYQTMVKLPFEMAHV